MLLYYEENKLLLADISKQKYKIPQDLDNKSGLLGAVIDRQLVVATGGKEIIPGFSISTRNER